jgi:FixJ family two-component response regulator
MGTMSVAIVDDDASANRALQRLLRGSGFEPHGFESAERFLSESSRSSFACLVLDVQLDGMSGLELQRELRAKGDDVPIIFVTAHDEAAYRAEAFSCGCTGFFRKTDPGKLIVAALRAVIDADGAR